MSTIKVKLSSPGVIAIGPYQPDTDYDVEAKEARRLIDVKGFVAATPEELKKLQDLEAKAAKAPAETATTETAV